MGAVVTLDLAEGAPEFSLPWIVTFGPLEDDEWEAVVAGPYERAHALALAESVVADEDLLAVVEPVYPHTTVEEIQERIAAAKASAEAAEDEFEEEFDEDDHEGHDHEGHDHDHEDVISAGTPPTPEEIRAGFARIASSLSSGLTPVG